MRRVPLVVALGAVLLMARGAGAACHSFTITVNPSTVTEGRSTTAVVQRDANVNPSQVDVTSVDETAIAGRDFEGVRQTVSFTTETMKTFEVKTVGNSTPDGPRTFRLHLSKGDGCQINPNFAYSSDARVTIQDDDPAVTPRPAPTPSATAVRAQSTVSAPASAAAVSPVASTQGIERSPEPAAASPARSPRLSAAPDKSSKPKRTAAVAAGIGILAAAAAGLVWARFRRR